MASEWYYEHLGATKGPVSSRELKDLAKREVVDQQTMVCKGRDGRMVPANKVRGLFPEAEPELSVEDPIAEAMKRYEIPEGCENFLFCLPAFYVAKSDGSISVKEAVSISYNAIAQGFIRTGSTEQKLFNKFAQNKLREFMGKSNLSDFSLLAAAIVARLKEYPEDEAKRIRDAIYTACTNVAEASGPMFRDKILPEEREMLDRILAEAL